MAYGISFSTPNGNVQIDSDTPGSGIIVVDRGLGDVTNVDLDEDMVFARPSSTPTSIQLALVNTTGSTYEFQNLAGQRQGSVVWVRARWANFQTASTSDYGLQVYNSDNELAFDSQLYTGDGGFGITGEFEAGASDGGAPNLASRITNDRDDYWLMNNTTRSTSTDPMATRPLVHYRGWQWQNTASSAVQQGVHWYGIQEYVGFQNAIQDIALPSPAVLLGERGSV